MMISEVCHEVKNWFEYDKIFGRFKIEEGVLRFLDNSASIPSDLGLQDGQYYRIAGSVFNDGVWQYHKPVIEPIVEPVPEEDTEEDTSEEPSDKEPTDEEPEEEIRDEEFKGAVWLMAVPRDFLNLVDRIAAWDEKFGGVDSAAQSPFSSESFGGYSYSKASGGSGSGGSTAVTWKNNFASDLNKWRKI